jgi:hypothetical protein
MAFWDNLFGKTENNFDHFENRLSQHEQVSTNKLHTTHPNVKGIFDKYKIDLKQVRKHGPKIAAGAAVLGAFLAIPHLFGHPVDTNKTPQPTERGQVTKPVPQPALQPSAEPTNTSAQTSGGGQSTTPPGSGVGTPTQTPPGETDQSKSQGHIYGRSYMAPPKEHGYHDLGLHKGAAKNPQVPDVGPHPSELEVNKQGKEEKA